MESVIARNVTEQLNKHNFINQSQHAFTKGKSYLTSFEFFSVKFATQAVDNGDSYDILYLDLSWIE